MISSMRSKPAIKDCVAVECREEGAVRVGVFADFRGVDGDAGAGFVNAAVGGVERGGDAGAVGFAGEEVRDFGFLAVFNVFSGLVCEPLRGSARQPSKTARSLRKVSQASKPASPFGKTSPRRAGLEACDTSIRRFSGGTTSVSSEEFFRWRRRSGRHGGRPSRVIPR